MFSGAKTTRKANIQNYPVVFTFPRSYCPQIRSSNFDVGSKPGQKKITKDVSNYGYSRSVPLLSRLFELKSPVSDLRHLEILNSDISTQLNTESIKPNRSAIEYEASDDFAGPKDELVPFVKSGIRNFKSEGSQVNQSTLTCHSADALSEKEAESNPSAESKINDFKSQSIKPNTANVINNVSGQKHEDKLFIKTVLGDIRCREEACCKSDPADQCLCEITATESKQGRKKRECKVPFLLGLLFNYLLISPLTVAFWSSTWTICDDFLFSDRCKVSTWTSAAVGFFLMTFSTLLQGKLVLLSGCGPLVWLLGSRFYSYVVSVACVNQWRSVWMVTHCYWGSSLTSSGLSLVVSLSLLVLLGCLRSVPAPPVYVSCLVQREDYFRTKTFLGSSTESRMFPVDVLISVLLIQSLIVTFWRGLWQCLDFLLLPGDPHTSALVSVGISLVVSALVWPLNTVVQKLVECCHKRHQLAALMLQDVVSLVYSVVSVTFWRGCWMLLSLHTYPLPYSLYVTHGFSFLALAFMCSANSIPVRDVIRDVSTPADKGVLLETSYMTQLYQAWLRPSVTRKKPSGEDAGSSCLDEVLNKKKELVIYREHTCV